MAQLHVLGPWHGPGEEKTAKRLEAGLPNDWDVIAGRDIPGGMGTVDLDLIVVGPHAVFLCEEKAWGRYVVAGEVNWYVNGGQRHNPVSQVSYASKVLAGRLKSHVKGWKDGLKALPHGVRPVFAHVVLSHDWLVLENAADLGENVVLRLADTADTLRAVHDALPDGMAAHRPALMAYLLGLPQRRDALPPKQIMQYEVLDAATPKGNAIVFPARTPAGEGVFLTCVPIDGSADPEQARLQATREHDALAALAAEERTWRVQGWFDWDGYRVTPVIVGMDATSLHRIAAQAKPDHDASGRVPARLGAAVAEDAFTALAAVHAKGITHRAIEMRTVEVTHTGRVRFRDFGRAHLPTTATIAPSLDDGGTSAAFRPPGVPLEAYLPADDVYAVALCLVQWLHGDASDEPDHDVARKRAIDYHGVGHILARCLSPDPGERLSAAEAAAALTPQPPVSPTPDPALTPPVRSEVMEVDALLEGRYRLLRPLGEGAWAVTWLAHDEHLDQQRTLKHMRPNRVGPEQVRAEYTHADRLRSRYCAKVYDMLVRPEPGVLVQEYVPGQSLQQVAASSRRLDQEQARRIAVDVLRGLADAHQQALYHRDVSPANIIVRDDGRAKLIDFGLASPVEAAQSAVGSPPFTAPEVWTRRRWSPAADIYSAAASVLFAMLGRYPYAGPGIDEREILVQPTASDVRRYGRSLLATLYSAVAAEPKDRPQDAAEFAEQVLRAREASVAPGQAVVNPTVAALRGLYRHSGIGNAGNRGMDDAFALDTYRPTLLDSRLVPAIRDGKLDVVVLSGNPGDGKTSFLVQVGGVLDRAGAVTLHADAAGWRKRLDGRTFVAVYDASESHGSLTSDGLLRAALDPAPDDDPQRRTVLIAANDGRIAQFFGDHAERYPALAAELERQRTTPAPADARTVLVDLKRRALALPDLDGPAVGADILTSLTALHRWEVCGGCAARSACPIRGNAERLRSERARRAVAELLLTSHLRRRRRATVRDVRSAFGWLITGDLSCEAVHAEMKAGQDPGGGARRRASDLAFDPESGDYLVQEWSELDPAGLAAPAAARAARGDRTLLPDLSAVGEQEMAHLKRSLFFGEWGEAQARQEVRSYRYFDEYLAALDAPGAALPRILLGMSRVLAYAGYEDDTCLALRDRVFEDEAVRAIVVIKELPASAFSLVTTTSASGYVESFPDQLELRHHNGARLRITLDTAELLMRAADGEILGDSGSAALRQEIEGFGNRLRLQPARSVRIVDGAGSAVRATIDADGRIMREAR
ncbi:protein kinase [Pseudonocardia aurantiaca]|uniref:non-specific serine/threonine protein kinase n=1 Tax=Pseudonocardia aurantiaca TaxID=75290 RepID=A0ABW4FXZ5_9PSEU